MKPARRLLELTEEYSASRFAREPQHSQYGGEPAGRDLDEIADDYEQTLKELLSQ